MSSVFIFDPGTVHSLKGLREVVDDESVEELKLKIIDEHVERQNICFLNKDAEWALYFSQLKGQ